MAELLILRADMPRSLHACMEEIDVQIRVLNGARADELMRLSGRLYSELRFGRIEDIISEGLHEYLTRCLLRLRNLGECINATYFYVSAD